MPTLESTNIAVTLQRDRPTSSSVQLHGLLRQSLRVTVSDGRIFLGTFAGTDKQLNIVIINAEEYRIGRGESIEGRYVGQVMVPWRFVVRVEAQSKDEREARIGDHIGLGSVDSPRYGALYL